MELASQKLAQFHIVGDPLTSLQRWLCTIAHHYVIDLLRVHAMEGPGSEALDRLPSPNQGDPTDRRFIEQILEALPARWTLPW